MFTCRRYELSAPTHAFLLGHQRVNERAYSAWTVKGSRGISSESLSLSVDDVSLVICPCWLFYHSDFLNVYYIFVPGIPQLKKQRLNFTVLQISRWSTPRFRAAGAVYSVSQTQDRQKNCTSLHRRHTGSMNCARENQSYSCMTNSRAVNDSPSVARQARCATLTFQSLAPS